MAITQLEIGGRGYSSTPFVDAYFAHSIVSDEERLALPVYVRMRLAGLVRFFAWRVLHASQYEPAEREANERRLLSFREALESAGLRFVVIERLTKVFAHDTGFHD